MTKLGNKIDPFIKGYLHQNEDGIGGSLELMEFRLSA
jgi:hypothetical protein